MKVLICIPCLLTGGTEIQTLNTVHALVQGGHEVTVACYFEHTPDMVARYRKAGAEVLLFSPEGIRVGGYKSILFLYRHLRRAVKAVRPDVVHVQYMAPGATVILLLWLMGVKNIIATAHTAADIYKDLRLIHFLQRHCLRAWTCITERAERSFFGTSQLYTPETVLGKRNHFTIYNSLPAKLGWSCNEYEDEDADAKGASVATAARSISAACDEGRFIFPEERALAPLGLSSPRSETLSPFIENCHPDGDSKHYTLHSKQEFSPTDSHESAQILQVASPLLASGAQSHLKGNLSSSSLSSSSQKDPSAPFVLGVVSRLEPIKGMDLVVPALAEVLKAYPATQLLVVGDGTLRASMEEQAAQLGCADHIRWVGRQPQEELPQWYGQMDIVLMPSRSEGFGLTAIEAMACGCVMVASDTGGLPEVVRDGVCGLLHRTEDVTDMAAKISVLIGDATLYDTLRTQSLKEVEKYSFERYAALMNDFYNKLGK